jgi:hypothetical protein
MKQARSAVVSGVEPSWAMWKLDLSARNGRIQAIWYVTVGGDDQRGNPVELHTEPMVLDCRPVGAAGVSGDSLVFKGGYFECDMPDLLEEAGKIISARWGDKYALKGGQEKCDCAPVGLAFAQGELTAEGQGSSSVFYHPSIRFAINTQGDAVQNSFHFAGMDSTGVAVDVKRETALESRYTWDKNDDIFRFDHYIQGQPAGSDKIHPQDAEIVTRKMAVLIGSRPGSQQPFLGTMTHLVVDPGCRVH